MSDGEVVERPWSYLRRFAPMTKEIRPAYRVDVLTHALFHYKRGVTENIGTVLNFMLSLAMSFVGLLLCRRIENANQNLCKVKENMQVLLNESPGAVN